jgi:hypothetical protein
VRNLPALAIATTLLCCATPPEERAQLELSYEEAFQKAVEHSNPEYESVARRELGKWMLGGIIGCNLPKGESFGLVVAIGSDGRPKAVWVDPTTSANQCLQRHIRWKARFSKPPFAPFFTTPGNPT